MKWPKKTGPAPARQSVSAPAPGAEPRAAGAFADIWVTGVGLQCLSGDRRFALLGAVGTNLSGARPDPAVSVPDPAGQGDRPVLSAPIAALAGIDHPGGRMQLLAEAALGQALGSLPETVNRERLLVATVLPAENCARGAVVKGASLEAGLRAIDPDLARADFRFIASPEGAAGALADIARELVEQRWDAALFGGVDSLVDAVTCTELALAGRVMTAGGSAGLVPGEGAAYLLLQAEKADQAGSGRQVLARITGLGDAAEPHPTEADRKPMTGLISAIRQALTGAALTAERLGGVVLPFGAETAGELEWYQVTRKLWPRRASGGEEGTEDLIESDQGTPEELRLHIALGEVGAAALPLALALACGRFEFDHPPLESILVCEAGEAPIRGAVVLQRAKAKKPA